MISKRKDEGGLNDYDREAYREHPLIERTINQLTRYDQLTSSYLAMVTLACVLEWL